MSKYRAHLTLSLTLAAALLAGACSRDKKPAGDTTALTTDTSLNRDLQLANRDTTAQPALRDVPAPNAPAEKPTATAPAPAATRPRAGGATRRPAPPPPRQRPVATRPSAPQPTAPASEPAAPVTTPSGNTVTRGARGSEPSLGTIPAGATVVLNSGSRVCTNTHNVGDRFTATVADQVTGSNGAVIPAGATVTLEVTELKRSENANDPIRMGFAVRSVTFGGKTYSMGGETASAEVTRVRNEPTSKDVQKVVGGAAIGAIIGRVIGKNTKGTVIGAATGAAAGAATAAATANFEGCVNPGARITVRLSDPVTVRVAS